jgi:hypothetical protein
MAFMFETRAVIRPTRFALAAPQLQPDYQGVWQDLPKSFTPDDRGAGTRRAPAAGRARSATGKRRRV